MPQSDLLARLAELKASRRAAGGTSKTSSFSSPLASGGLFRGTIQPIVYGEELALVKEPSALCLGKIGSGGNLCLKRETDCDTEAHFKKKGILPSGICLIQLKGDEKGYENVVLETFGLDKAFIDELLEMKNVSWASEFAKIRANDTRSTMDMELLEDVLTTAKKHRTFGTPAKHLATEDILDKISLLDTAQSLLIDVSELELDTEGAGTSRDFSFVPESYSKVCADVYEKLLILIENNKCAADVILGLQPFVESHTKPIEHLVSGLRIEIASLQAQLGDKELARKDIPPVLWNAVEAGFDSFLDLETKLCEVTAMAKEAHVVAGELLSGAEIDSKSQVRFENNSSILEGDNFLQNLTSPRVVNGKLYHPSSNKAAGMHNGSNGNNFNSDGNGNAFNNGGNYPFKNNGNAPPVPNGDPDGNHSMNCNENDLLCGRCMVRFHDLESKLGATNVRVGNLEDAKSGNIDSAIMVKDRIYRGRGDITAELDHWFPVSQSKRIDAGLFPTPNLILNLMHADICSKKAPKIPLDQKDLIKLEIRRSDADAFYALQSDKPEFMVTNELCPNFNYKATKAQRDSATIRFLPSHEDFGNGLDSDSLHFKFKTSLEHVKSERERYIESVLSDHPDHRVLSISKQLLNDSCKFISQILGFMDETYASCYDSFGATTEAWDLVSHCIEEIFSKELKPCLKYCVAQDLVDVRDALIGVVHASFSLNCKVRELTSIGLKNHHSTTTSHVRFVMKMAKTSRKSEVIKVKPSPDKSAVDTAKFQTELTALQKENKDLKAHLKRLESRLDSHMNNKSLHEGSSKKKKTSSSSNIDRDTSGDSVDTQ